MLQNSNYGSKENARAIGVNPLMLIHISDKSNSDKKILKLL